MSIKRTKFIPPVVEPGVDVSDADAAVGEVLSGKTFYSVAAPRKTGTISTVAIVAANDNYPAGYHVGNVGGLDAIDPDLAAGNIKSGTTIFGKLGTYESIMTSEDQSVTKSAAAHTSDSSISYAFYQWKEVAGGADIDPYSTNTTTYGTAALVLAGYGGYHWSTNTSKAKMKLYMDGVEMAESAYFGQAAQGATYITLLGSKTMTGSKIIKTVIHNYGGSTEEIGWFSRDTTVNNQQNALIIGAVVV